MRGDRNKEEPTETERHSARDTEKNKDPNRDMERK